MNFASFSAFRQAFASTRSGIFTEYLILAALGAFSAVIFPGIDWNILAWFVLLPLYFATRTCSAGGAFLRGLAWGYFWSLCSFFWLREIAVPIPFILAFVLGLFPAVWVLILHFLRQNLAYSPVVRLGGAERRAEIQPFRNPAGGILFVFAAASAWCVLEWVRSWIGTGLPWNYLGSTQWRNLVFIQICEFTGVFGVSFLVAFFNIAFGLTLTELHFGLRHRKYVRPYPLLAAFVLLLANFSFGLHLFKQNAPNPENVRTEAVGLVQCDISQRRTATHDQAKEALDVCLQLSEELLKKNEREKSMVRTDGGADSLLKLIIWPETAVPYAYAGGAPLSGEYRERLGELIRRYKVPFLVGSIDFQLNSKKDRKYEYDVYNAALLIDRPGGVIADRYYKIHRVPFGEYVPYGDEFPILTKMVGMGRNLTPGTRFHPIEVSPGVKAGVSICYESVFPNISRGHVLNGANLLLIISNDAWYPTSYEPDQHYVNGLFRAVENRLPLVRSGNSNYSVLISPRGELLDSIPSRKFHPGQRIRSAGTFLVPVPFDHKPTFYTVFGNLFIAFCGLVTLCALIWAFANWMLFRNAQADAKLYKTVMENDQK